MTKSTQKLTERVVVDAVLSSVAPALAANLVASESPDFLVSNGNASVGIEVRRLLWREDAMGRPLKAAEALEDKSIVKAARLWQERRLPSVHVTVSWLPHSPPTTRRTDEIAERIVDAVAATLPAVDGESVTIKNAGVPGDPLPPEVFSVLVARFSVQTAPFWGISRAGYVADCDGATIEAALADKEPCVAEYRRKAKELWLILAVMEDAPSSFVDVTPGVLEHQYKSSFDRVFLVEAAKGRVHELTLAR